MKLTLTRRLILAVAVIATTFAVAVTALGLATGDLRKRVELGRAAGGVVRNVDQMRSDVLDAQVALRTFTVTPQAAVLEPLRAAERDLPFELILLRNQTAGVPRQARQSQALWSAIDTYLNGYAEPLVRQARGTDADRREARQAALVGGERRTRGLVGQLDALRTTITSDVNTLGDRAAARAENAVRIAIAAGILAGLLMIASVVFLAQSVAGPLRRTAGAAEQLGEGDLMIRLPESGRDEVGQLGGAFNRMAVALQAGQQQLAQTNRQLRDRTVALEQESERRRRLADLNRAVLDATGDAIHLFGTDGQTILANPAMERFARDVVGLPVPATEVTPAAIVGHVAGRVADPESYRRQLDTIFADPTHESTIEYELVDTGRWVQRHTAPVRTEDGTLLGRIFVMREITEQRAAERAKDELMATVSHELRTPLAAILGFTELLIDREFDDAHRREYLGTIQAQATRLAALIDDFLDLQRLEHGTSMRAFRPVAVRGLLEQQLALFADPQDRDRLVLQLDPDANLQVLGDGEQLGRAVMNLLSNALKYSPEGGPVTVNADADAETVTISVTDRGIGIPEAERGRLFERFYRVDNSATTPIGGTGLGLAVVREIARAHGGEVDYESVPGRGSRFWLRLPRA